MAIPVRIMTALAKQLVDLSKNPSDGIQAVKQEGAEITDIKADIIGPCFFLTKIFHPNVSSTGQICVNTLKKDWNPAKWSIRHIFQVIKCLLIVPFPQSSLNEQAGKLFMEDYEEYFSQAEMYTKIYAVQQDEASPIKHPVLQSRVSMPAKIEAPFRSSFSTISSSSKPEVKPTRAEFFKKSMTMGGSDQQQQYQQQIQYQQRLSGTNFQAASIKAQEFIKNNTNSSAESSVSPVHFFNKKQVGNKLGESRLKRPENSIFVRKCQNQKEQEQQLQILKKPKKSGFFANALKNCNDSIFLNNDTCKQSKPVLNPMTMNVGGGTGFTPRQSKMNQSQNQQQTAANGNIISGGSSGFQDTCIKKKGGMIFRQDPPKPSFFFSSAQQQSINKQKFEDSSKPQKRQIGFQNGGGCFFSRLVSEQNYKGMMSQYNNNNSNQLRSCEENTNNNSSSEDRNKMPMAMMIRRSNQAAMAQKDEKSFDYSPGRFSHKKDKWMMRRI